VAAAALGAIATVALRGTTVASTPPRPSSLSTATVVRTDLADTVLTEGTLGYAASTPVVNRLSGTYTWLPAQGTVIGAGGTLYRVDDQPVTLMTGPTPAWRDFALGMSDGPDVTELEANLIALGDARGLLAQPTDAFSWATAAAIERWQTQLGQTPTGRLPLGSVVLMPGSVLVGALAVAPGQGAAPGDLPFAVTGTTRTVTVPLGPNLPTVPVGEPVSIVLPTQVTTPGRVTAVGPPAPSAGSSSGSGQGAGSSGQSQASAVLTVTPADPAATGAGNGVAVQVTLTTQSASHVLAVPITALLALAGGGYGVEVVTPSGAHHLVGVTTGLFTATEVEVRGGGLQPGDRVLVAQ
jgi:hypothetical protein